MSWIGFKLTLGLALMTSTIGCKRQPQISPAALTTAGDEPVQHETAYENIDPSVAYVEDTTCAECHAEIVAEFARHPMGRSLTPVKQREAIEIFGASHRAEFDSKQFRYSARSDGDRLVHSRALLPTTASPEVKEEYPLAYAVGSGQKGRSYLVNHENRLFMSPLTWYPEKEIWDLSPGYEYNDLGFGRPILEDCLFCHANKANLEPHAKNKYTEPIFTGHAIGCQRCHGPGDLHVQRHQASAAVSTDYDRSIVNPSRLDPGLREAICQQCHLVGAARVTRADTGRYDFRPGQPLDAVIATFVLTPSQRDTADHFVGQVEQMYASRCFEASGGKLGCISCHDPHAVPSDTDRVTFYRMRCLRCHTDDSCGVKLSKRTNGQGLDDCISCHMPPVETDVRHAATTNHRIPRSPESIRKSDNTRYAHPIMVFPPRALRDEIDESRDLALGLIQASQYHPQRITDVHLEKVIVPLQQAVSRNPLDIDAAEGLGDLLLMLGRPQAITQYRAVLRQQQDREHSVVKLADASLGVGQNEDAVRLWRAANEINPWMASYRHQLGSAFARSNQWDEVSELALEGTKRFPTSPQIWHLLVESRLRRGEQDAARRALAVLLRLQPDAAEEIQRWFDSHPLEAIKGQ